MPTSRFLTTSTGSDSTNRKPANEKPASLAFCSTRLVLDVPFGLWRLAPFPAAFGLTPRLHQHQFELACVFGASLFWEQA